MAFKKIFKTEAPIIVGDTKMEKLAFPPGFRYRIGSIIYTVRADVTQEASSPMREISLSDGGTEIIPVESIARDLKEPDCQVMEMDSKYTIKTAVAKKNVKKAKKKKAKKKNHIKGKNKKKNVR